jgi:hypothetical protein
VKLDWSADPNQLLGHARHIAEKATNLLQQAGIEDTSILRNRQSEQSSLRTLTEEEAKLLLTDSISPLPLHKTLLLLECMKEDQEKQWYKYERLALAKALVDSIGNLRFGPEVGIGPLKADTPVISAWLNQVQEITNDLRNLQQIPNIPTKTFYGDARQIENILEPQSIDAVITSPPYPNEKDYTRTTRLESVLLGFIHNKTDLRNLKKGLLRSNTRNVYQGDSDDAWITHHQEIQEIANAIEARRIELGKTSGFEKLYARVTKLYFGGIARHLSALRTVLRPNAQLAYVVGDQASYLRIMIPTGKLIAEIAVSLGYELVRIDLFRTRFATATKVQLREEVVVLRWPENSTILPEDTKQKENQIGHDHFAVTALANENENTANGRNTEDSMYALGDEQALLAKLRYNRLIDIFTGVTCYSLQNHLRTTINGMGQVETDEIYVGIDRRGAQYVIPLQAKGGNDKIGIVQIEQDIALCAEKFPLLICRPIAAQFIDAGRIALFEFEESDEGIKLHREHHYKLVPLDNMTEDDLRSYRNRSLE